MSTYESPSDVPEPTQGQITTEPLRWHGRAAVLTVSGDVDMLTAPRFEEALIAALGEQPETLVIDLDQVAFFSSDGLSVLINTYQKAGDQTALCVVATNSAVVRPLRITALDRKIPLYDSRQQALAEPEENVR
jgi:anti-anti-sigma factor